LLRHGTHTLSFFNLLSVSREQQTLIAALVLRQLWTGHDTNPSTGHIQPIKTLSIHASSANGRDIGGVTLPFQAEEVEDHAVDSTP
jgi:hypothetical protein